MHRSSRGDAQIQRTHEFNALSSSPLSSLSLGRNLGWASPRVPRLPKFLALKWRAPREGKFPLENLGCWRLHWQVFLLLHKFFVPLPPLGNKPLLACRVVAWRGERSLKDVKKFIFLYIQKLPQQPGDDLVSTSNFVCHKVKQGWWLLKFRSGFVTNTQRHWTRCPVRCLLPV